MSNVIILGDPHIGKSANLGKIGVGSNLNSRIADQLELLDWTLDMACEHSASHIIITGDVFEEPKPHHSLITYFVSWLKKCQIYNVNVHIIIGNHDILRSGNIISSPLDIIIEAELENVFVYKIIDTITIDKSAFTFLPFFDRKSLGTNSNSVALSLLKDALTYEIACIPLTYHKVIIGHLAIEGSIPIGDEIDDITNELYCPLDMFAGYDYVWMGHVHKPQILSKIPLISHIGSMDISNFGETNQQKYIVVFNCETGEYIKEILPTRPMKKVQISIPENTDDTTAYVIDFLDKNGEVYDKSITRVEITLESSNLLSVNKALLEKHLQSKGVFCIAGISESKKTVQVKKDKNNILDTQMDVVSAIKTYANAYVPEKERAKFIDLSTSIYNSYKAEVKD
jgi:exonuclease SbcD